MTFRMRILMAGVLWVSVAGQASAQQLHDTYQDWKVFSYKQGGKTLCYIASVPTKKSGNYSKRDEPFVLVTHRKANLDEISVSSGYPYKKESEVTVTISGERFSLFTRDERAWAYDEEQDNRMAGAMIKGNRMEVKGTSKKGTYSQDTYSLKGFTNAHKKMKALCR